MFCSFAAPCRARIKNNKVQQDHRSLNGSVTVKNKTLQPSITLYLSDWTLRNRDKPLESEFDSVVEVHTLRDKVKTFLYRDSSLMNRDISLNLLRCQGVTTQTLLNHIQNIVIQKTSIDIAIKKPCFNSRMNICSMVLISTKI